MLQTRVTFGLLLVAILASLASAKVLATPKELHRRQKQLLENAKRTDLSKEETECVLDVDLEEECMDVPDGREICGVDVIKYEHKINQRMQKPCGVVARAEAEDREDDSDDEDDSERSIVRRRETAIRRPFKPDNPVAKVANFLGLQETVRARQCYECYSGCHFCCINVGASGLDFCFSLYCGGNGDCS